MAVTLMACYGSYGPGYGGYGGEYPDGGYLADCEYSTPIVPGQTLSWAGQSANSATAGSCGGDDTFEVAFAVQLDAQTQGRAGTFTITTSGAPATTYARSSCADPATEIACGTTGPLSFHVGAAAPFTVFVDGPSWFELTVDFLPDQRCGNGVVDPGEECDDGNAVGSDGCSAECLVERCFGEEPLSLGPNAGDTSLGRDGIRDLCSGFVGREVVYSYTPTEYGTLTLTLDTESDLVMSTQPDCSVDVASACGNTAAPVILAASPGVPIHVFVGGGSFGAEGPFVLTAEMKPSCGDGVVDPWEQCDDGNTADGDGCSASCTPELPIYCAAAPPLVLGTNAGDNTGGQNLLAAACTGQQGKEALYSFTAPSDGILVLDLDAQAFLGLYVLEACPAGPLLGCADSAPGGQHETLSLHMSAGAACTIVVDGSGPGETGPFDLTAYFLPSP